MIVVKNNLKNLSLHDVKRNFLDAEQSAGILIFPFSFVYCFLKRTNLVTKLKKFLINLTLVKLVHNSGPVSVNAKKSTA